MDIPIVADAKEAILDILELAQKEPALNVERWISMMESWQKSHPIKMEGAKGNLTPQMIIEAINKDFKEPIVVTDVGQNQMWATQYVELHGNRQLLTSGGLGTMGYGFPAALGACIGNPGREVVCISGDGGAQMNIQEMATAVVQELPVVFIWAW